MNVLVYTSLYPNAAQPTHGVFVENRVRRVSERPGTEVRVVAPVPWFPWTSPRFGKYAEFAAAPRRETRHGLEVSHPRYPVVPKVGMSVAPPLMFAGTRGAVRRATAGLSGERAARAVLLDAHYLYPDGVAAAMLARSLHLPLVLNARGSDVNLIAGHALPRRWILWAAARADAVVAVSCALRERLAGLGVARSKIHVLRNGVDLETFRRLPAPRRAEWRRRLLPRSDDDAEMVLLSVGKLDDNKGHHLTLATLTRLPGTHLLICGKGPWEGRLREIAERLGVADRVSFCGTVAHEELVGYYNAADALVLASEREGMPNVVLEAMACGTPVIATGVGGVPEVMEPPGTGTLLPERSPEAVFAAVRQLRRRPPDPDGVRAHAEQFSWEATVRGELELFRTVLEGSRQRG